MKLSIVIVNYNVEHFLDQCLHSVFKAIKGFEAEVFVVDNLSVDGSVKMVQEKYPQVHCIVNEENVGFSVANNQAMKISKGEYTLLLNPDTIVEEDTFVKAISFMDEHPDAGGLGIRMLDGTGNYLPESKRGFPTPWVAFCKMTGLTKFFPKSKRFARYYLGHLSPKENQEIEVIAGAFMMMRKSALDQVGLLDETFFMYGEDIDLSYRIIKGGFKNYYLAESEIIHYKGESTKKGSLNYVFIFYNAMIIFAKKHFTSSHAGLFVFFINMAIYLRAGVALLARFLKLAFLPITDALVLFTGLHLIKFYYENYFKFVEGGSYPNDLITISFSAYIFIWLSCIYLYSGYLRPTKLKYLLTSIGVGSLVILAIYALLPEHLRFSRAITLMGMLYALVILPSYRGLLQRMFQLNIFIENDYEKRLMIIGSKEEANRVHAIIESTGVATDYLKIVDPSEDLNEVTLREMLQVFKVNEVVFCARDLSSQRIIEYMGYLRNEKIEIKIAPPESLYIIGSNSIHTQGEIYTIDVNQISKPHHRKNKRLMDFGLALLVLLLFPVSLIATKSTRITFVESLNVLLGLKTWIGYSSAESYSKLPSIKPGVYKVAKDDVHDPEQIANIDFAYARDYRVSNDLQFFTHRFFQVDGV